ncbi:hypothetical protein AB205_0095040, partial [Aquarana catesbeiana]
QGEELKDIKAEIKEEEEERLVSGDQQSMEEWKMTMKSKQEKSSLHMDTNDHNVRNTSEESSDKSHSRTLRSHSRNTLIDPSIPEESSSGQEGDHTEESSLSCSVCGKLFTKKRELLKHKKYHNAERPYSCSECGKCFTSKQNLHSAESVSLANNTFLHTGTVTRVSVPSHVQSAVNVTLITKNFVYIKEVTQVSVLIHVQSAGKVSVRNFVLLHTREITRVLI